MKKAGYSSPLSGSGHLGVLPRLALCQRAMTTLRITRRAVDFLAHEADEAAFGTTILRVPQVGNYRRDRQQAVSGQSEMPKSSQDVPDQPSFRRPKALGGPWGSGGGMNACAPRRRGVSNDSRRINKRPQRRMIEDMDTQMASLQALETPWAEREHASLFSQATTAGAFLLTPGSSREEDRVAEGGLRRFRQSAWQIAIPRGRTSASGSDQHGLGAQYALLPRGSSDSAYRGWHATCYRAGSKCRSRFAKLFMAPKSNAQRALRDGDFTIPKILDKTFCSVVEIPWSAPEPKTAKKTFIAALVESGMSGTARCCRRSRRASTGGFTVSQIAENIGDEKASTRSRHSGRPDD